MTQEDSGVASGPGSRPTGRAASTGVSPVPASIPNAGEWPTIEYDDGYPVDEEFSAFFEIGGDFRKAARWLMSELPRASEHMPCFCDIGNSRDIVGKPCKLVKFSTGGWSGAESIIALIERRFDLSHFMLSWKRGGHFVFEIPTKYLRDSDGSPKGGDACGSVACDDSAGRSEAKVSP